MASTPIPTCLLICFALLLCSDPSILGVTSPSLFAHAFSQMSVVPFSRSKINTRSATVQCNASTSPSGDESKNVDLISKESTDSNAGNQLAAGVISHHTAIKTRNIENAIKFYSLLGFEVESKFVAGPARAAWLLHKSSNNNDDSKNSPQSRIELLEVPSYMVKYERAIDLTKREELLGLNHFALDVTHCIPRPDNDDGASANGSACALYQLQEWMDDLNALSIDRFGKSLRVALEPTKRIVGKEVYEMAFIYDADGSLVELLNHSGSLQQDMMDGWEPWDGQGFVQ